MARTSVASRTSVESRTSVDPRTVAGYSSLYDIVGLAQWLKADAITGKVDNDTISSWSDSSGRGVAATQATGSKQPLYKTNIINSLPVVRGDGIDDALTATQAIKFGAGTVFLLVGAWATNAGAITYAYRNDAGQRTYINRPVSSTSVRYTKGSTTGVTIGNSTVNTTDFVLLMITWKSEGGSQTADYYRDLTTVATNVSTTLGTNGTADQLFSFNTTQEWAQCDIAELARFDRYISGTEFELVRNSLLAKYNLFKVPIRASA